MSLLSALAHALATPDERKRIERLSDALAEVVPHRALAFVMDGCARSPIGRAGEPDIADRTTVGDITRLGSAIPSGQAWQGEADVAGERRPVAAATAPADLNSLVLVRTDATPLDAEQLTILHDAWSLFAVAMQHTLAGATPADLPASRAAAGDRARVATELADAHDTALSGILGTLRARHLDDHAARQAATDLASSALVELRASVERERRLGDEPIGEAFERLRPELLPLARFSPARLELVAPVDDVALPAPVAQTARAIVRGAVLALLEQAEVQRLRIAWTLDGELEVSVRDDGPGLLSASPSTDALAERARALGGTVEIQSVPGWGTELLARLPLDDRTGVEAPANDPLAALHPRELEVLAELALGRRNRDIAETLSISENTVKFHVANIFAKLGVSSRNQAALIARDAGVGRTTTPAG